MITHEYPPVGGGGGKVAADLNERLSLANHEIRVITSHIKGLPRSQRLNGVTVIRLPCFRTQPYQASFLSMAVYVIIGAVYCMRMVRNWRPDLIHVHFAVPGGALARFISRSTQVPYVLTIHLGDVPGGVPSKTEQWFRLVYPFTHQIWREAKRVIAVSDFTRQLALIHYPVPIQVIPNGVDLDQLNPGLIRTNEIPQIVFAGRLVEQKNPLQVVRTLYQLKDLVWHCTIIGDGPLREDLQREIAQLDLQSRCTLTGWKTPEEVIEYFKRSDILFMPSLSEGFPVTGVQASALGLALVVSRAGGFPEIVVHGENGFVIDAYDTLAMQAALHELLVDPQKLLKARLRSRELASRYDLNLISRKYLQIFQEVIA